MPPVVGALVAAGVTAGATFGTQVVIGAGIVAATKAAVAAFGVSLLASLTSARGRNRGEDDSTQVVRASNLPARWIVGRARVGGQLVFYNETNQDNYQGSTPKPHSVNLALVLSEGSLEQIEKVWINGEEVVINSRTIDRDGVHLNFEEKWKGNLAVWEYFAADGTGGASLRDEAVVNTFDENLDPISRNLWTTDHQLKGKSWVHVKLIQNDYGGDVESRLWDRFPEINFLVKGIKITWPGQDTPTWTESAAAIRYWWLTERCKISQNSIDVESFLTAELVCNEKVRYTIPSEYVGYEPESLKYSINGVISSEDDPDTINQEFDFCWQGYVVEADAKLYFRPGVDRPISAVLIEKDIISVDQIRTAPILQERINAMSMSISQSRSRSWQQQDILRQQDLVIARSRDNNQQLWTNIGTRRFISDPLAAARLLRVALRRVQALGSYTYTVKPGQQLQWLSISPGDWIRVENPSLGIEGTMFVVGVATNTNWSVTLILQPQAANTYVNPPASEIFPNEPSSLEIPRVEVYHSDVHSDHGDVTPQHTNIHTNVPHSNVHTNVPTQHGDHTDHTDDHNDSPGGNHGDRPHTNNHDDAPSSGTHQDNHDDENHGDRPYIDDHGDLTHQDQHNDENHGDRAYIDDHGDLNHVDNHDDVSHGDRPYIDDHGDLNHVDNHDDVNHGDRAYIDDHYDTAMGSHQDRHFDDMGLGEGGGEHEDQHVDESPNTHGDTHVDMDHSDSSHVDDHQDVSFGHGDRHYDDMGFGEVGGEHEDQHNDYSPNTHGDIHVDINHADSGHVDDHQDVSFGHGDRHYDDMGLFGEGGLGEHEDQHNDYSPNTHGDIHVDIDHVDSGHVNNHGDVSFGHGDRHYDDMGFGEPGGEHEDQHNDYSPNTHGDIHVDIDHADGSHTDNHDDNPGGGVHLDDHDDISHTNTPGGIHTNTHDDQSIPPPSGHSDGYSGMHGDSHGDMNHTNTHVDRSTGNLVHINVHQDHTDQLTQVLHNDHEDTNLEMDEEHSDHTDLFPIFRRGIGATASNDQGMTLPTSLGGRRNSRISTTEWADIPYAVIALIDGNIHRTITYHFNARAVGVEGEVRLFNKTSQLQIGSSTVIDSAEALPFVHPSVDTLVDLSSYVLQAKVSSTPTRRQGLYVWGSQVNPGN